MGDGRDKGGIGSEEVEVARTVRGAEGERRLGEGVDEEEAEEERHQHETEKDWAAGAIVGVASTTPPCAYPSGVPFCCGEPAYRPLWRRLFLLLPSLLEQPRSVRSIRSWRSTGSSSTRSLWEGVGAVERGEDEVP